MEACPNHFLFERSVFRLLLFFTGNEASPQTPPPPRFAWSPSPAIAGADETSFIVLAMHPHPSRLNQSHESFASEQEGRRSADRRHPTKLRTISGAAARGTPRARLPALHRGTRHAGRNQHWLSSRPALPETRLLRALPVVASLESTEHLGDRS